MKIYDATNRMADVTPENVHEFVDWWLFWRAYDALHFKKLNRTVASLGDAVKFTLSQNNISVEIVPVVIAKAEHIKVLCEGDQDLFDFVWNGDNVAIDNPYAARYAPDRFWSSVEAETLTFVEGLPVDRSLTIDDEAGMPPLYNPEPDGE